MADISSLSHYSFQGQYAEQLTLVLLRFRWVSLQLQFLRTLKFPTEFRKRLGELPKDLRDAYDQTYKARLRIFNAGV